MNSKRKEKGEGRGQKHLLFSVTLFLLSLLPSPFSPLLSAAEPQVLLSTTSLLPGETLRIEVDGALPSAVLKAKFLGKTYPLYPIGPNASRALIGLPLDTEPGPYPLQLLGLSTELARSIEVSTKVFITENVNFSSQKTALMQAEHRESLIVGKAKKYLSRDQQWVGVFIYPVDGPLIGEFGIKRLRNGHIVAGFHKGIDLRAAKGTPLLASNSGTVILASAFRAHGKTVMINHGQGVMTIYLHLDSIAVKLNQKVRQGQEIGKVGSTGLATAPHVHFQVFVHGVPVDPKAWMEKEF